MCRRSSCVDGVSCVFEAWGVNQRKSRPREKQAFQGSLSVLKGAGFGPIVLDPWSKSRKFAHRRHSFRIDYAVMRPSSASTSFVSPQKQSNTHSAGTCFNLFQTEKRPLPGSWTGFADFVPFLFRRDVRGPERPCLTLNRPHRIHFAVPFLRVKERTITVLKLGQRQTTLHQPRVKQTNFPNGFIQIFGNSLQLFLTDPNNTRCPRAAVATLRTGEVQAILMPWLLSGICFVRHFLWNQGQNKNSRSCAGRV
jgi:hypothetical protein